jgi:hypothetical protein
MIQDSSHFYRADGTACHTVKGKNGQDRATTIRDARSLRLIPSVTTYLKSLAKGRNLEQWSYRQVAMAALTYPRKADDVLDDQFLDKIIDDAFQQTRDAADLGGKVHKALEQFFANEPHDPEMEVYVQAVAGWMASENVHVMQRELTIVNQRDGYAGRADGIIDSRHGLGILDYKCRKSNPKYPMNPWEDNACQIAAYFAGQFGGINDNASGVNLLISYTEPGRVEATWYDAAKLREEWELFKNVMAIWRTRNGYDPRQAT